MRIGNKVGMIGNGAIGAPGIVSRLDAAVRLGVSIATLDVLARRGLLTRVYKPGGLRSCGFTEESVNAYQRPSAAFCPFIPRSGDAAR